MPTSATLPPYPGSLAGTLLAVREAVMAPLRPLLREAGVTDQQWRVLRVLADAGPLDARGIAELALLYPPSVTRILRELAERGLINRSTDEADRRRSVIGITAAGKTLVQETARRTAVLLDRYAEAFGQERLAAFIAEADTLARTLSAFAPGEAGAAPDED